MEDLLAWSGLLGFTSKYGRRDTTVGLEKGIILPFHKGKGSSRRDCKNYRGITLLSVPGKAFAHILLARVKDRLLLLRRKEQTGFTPRRSTIDRIITLTTLLQARREFRQPMWIAYIDLKAAFDSVDRAALWALLLSIGIPRQIVDLIKELDTDTMSAVRVDEMLSDWFRKDSGVRQGCAIAPNIFLSPMDRILDHTVHRRQVGVSLGSETFSDLDFADDVALLTEMLNVCILAMEIMQEEAAIFGIEINWSKAKIQAVGTQHFPNVVHVAGNDVEVVDCFMYLSVQISNDGSSKQEVRRRIAMTRDCFQVLQNNIWRSCIRMETKIRLLKAYVFQVLLYAAEKWPLTSELEKKLDVCLQWA